MVTTMQGGNATSAVQTLTICVYLREHTTCAACMHMTQTALNTLPTVWPLCFGTCLSLCSLANQINSTCICLMCCALQVFRAWTQDTEELIQERPQKLMRLVVATHHPGCRPVPQATGADMLSAAPLSAGFSQGGKWGAELEEMFVNSMLPADAAGLCHQISCSGFPGACQL